jgi:hypothetical protein
MKSKIEMQEEPKKVVVEHLPDGGYWVSLRDNIVQDEVCNEQGATQIVYRADEVLFALPEKEVVTVEVIEKDFNAWWNYGSDWSKDDSTPSIIERLEAAEEFIALYLMGGI